MNTINVIFPYLHHGAWVFDDASRGLDKEPFIAGMPAMINHFTAEIPTADTGFQLTFSAQPFPTAQAFLTKECDADGGAWYVVGNFRGWLCPALLKYFDTPPNEIHFACEVML